MTRTHPAAINLQRVKALYLEETAMDPIVDGDIARFQAKVQETKLEGEKQIVLSSDPINALAGDYTNGLIGAKKAAAEIGLSETEFEKELDAGGNLGELLKVFRTHS